MELAEMIAQMKVELSRLRERIARIENYLSDMEAFLSENDIKEINKQGFRL